MQLLTCDIFTRKRALLPTALLAFLPAMLVFPAWTCGQDPADGPSVAPAELIDQSVNPESTSSEETTKADAGLSFLNLLTRGGWFMIPLAVLSLLVVTIGFERTLSLRRDKLFPRQLVNKLALLSRLEGGLDPRKAYQACQEYPSSASTLIRAALTPRRSPAERNRERRRGIQPA